MTRWVQMVVGISGGRHDGRPWPPAHGIVDVPDWEAEDLIRGGNAVPAEGPEPEPAPEPEPVPITRPLVDEPTGDSPAASVAPPYVSEVAEVPATAEVGGYQAPEPGPVHGTAEWTAEPEPVTETVAQAPRPSEPKQAWIDYAVSQGADVHAATNMSKADLMSRYGGRL